MSSRKMNGFNVIGISVRTINENGEAAKDIDILFVLEEVHYPQFQKDLNALQSLKSKHIHAILQTQKDLSANLKRHDAVLLDILATGIILWGQDVIVNAVHEAQK